MVLIPDNIEDFDQDEFLRCLPDILKNTKEVPVKIVNKPPDRNKNVAHWVKIKK